MTETIKPTQTGLALLRVPFESHQIGKLPKPYKKDAEKGKCNVCGGFHGLPAAHLDYVGHAATTDRLLDADPAWFWEPMGVTAEGLPKFDDIGGLWIRLTVLGVTRIGYGNAEKKGYSDMGAREKEAIGDAIRNAAMRFGAALDLWHKGDLHGGEYDDAGAGGDERGPIDGHPADVRERQDSAPPPPAPGRGDLGDYPKDKFETNLPEWKRMVEAGEKTSAQIITMVSTRGVLNPVQKAKLQALRKKA